jgi:hypothetical protein
MRHILLALLLGATVVRAADQTILGTQLLVKDPGAAEKRKVTGKAKEKASPNTFVGDPTLDGATLTVRAEGATSTEQTFPLPQGTNSKGKPFWTVISHTPHSPTNGYKYKDSKGENGPVAQAAIKISKKGVFTLSFNASGKLGPVSVVPPDPGEGGCVLLELTGGDSYSVRFADGKVTNKGGTLFKVKKPAGQGTCVIPSTTTTTSTVTTTSTTTSTIGSTTSTILTTTTTTTSFTTSTFGTSTTSTSTTSTTSTTGTTIFAGPAFPPVGGTVDFVPTGNAQDAGGADIALSNFSPTGWTALYWGPFDQNLPAAGLDGANHVLSTFLGISGVGDTVATWEGTSPWTNPGDMVVYDVPIRFTLTIVAGGLSFEPSTGIPGLDPGPGTGIDVVIDVAPLGTATDFTTNWAFTADIPTDLSGFIPLSNVPLLGGGLSSSFGGGFYSQP